MNLSFNTRDPVYIQVIRYFKEQIARGELKAGQEIPSRRELASLLKINPNTAQRAYKEMEEQGLIFTERNHPSIITEDQKILSLVREELIMEAVETFMQSITPINPPLEEIVELLKKKYEKSRKEGL
jgi:DNA-binding transcriptional regulator YhcF (GntR family)